MQHHAILVKKKLYSLAILVRNLILVLYNNHAILAIDYKI
jgi:hypothetical protein